jgi:hypothetical protein
LDRLGGFGLLFFLAREFDVAVGGNGFIMSERSFVNFMRDDDILYNMLSNAASSMQRRHQHLVLEFTSYFH